MAGLLQEKRKCSTKTQRTQHQGLIVLHYPLPSLFATLCASLFSPVRCVPHAMWVKVLALLLLYEDSCLLSDTHAWVVPVPLVLFSSPCNWLLFIWYTFMWVLHYWNKCSYPFLLITYHIVPLSLMYFTYYVSIWYYRFWDLGAHPTQRTQRTASVLYVSMYV